VTEHPLAARTDPPSRLGPDGIPVLADRTYGDPFDWTNPANRPRLRGEPQQAMYPPPTVIVEAARPQLPGPNHLLHAVVSILTGGLWLPVWFVINRRATKRAKKAARRG
jgi:hypothetical protein